MTHEVLIDRIVASNQDGKTFGMTSAATARLLPNAGEAAWIVHEQRDIQGPDVNAQFQGVRGRDAVQPASKQIGLDCPTFVG